MPISAGLCKCEMTLMSARGAKPLALNDIFVGNAGDERCSRSIWPACRNAAKFLRAATQYTRSAKDFPFAPCFCREAAALPLTIREPVAIHNTRANRERGMASANHPAPTSARRQMGKKRPGG
jgi:hypothetical protein